MYRKLLIYVIVSLAGVFIAVKANAQTNRPLTADTTRVAAERLLMQLQERDSVKFYYKPQWFRNRNPVLPQASLPMDAVLSRICNLYDLTYVVIDGRSVVFMPKDKPQQATAADIALVQVVGNPEESGKYKKATITGTISDGKTGDPLPGAILTADRQKGYAVSDREGHYTLTLPVGEYKLSLKFVGYEDQHKNIRLVSNGTLDFDIFEKSIQLREVTITDERADMNVSRTQMSAFRLDNKTIKELPVSLGETDIIKSVTLLPGVQSVGDFGSGFIVRGGSTDQNLITIEDVPLFNSSHLFGLTSVVNPDVLSGVTLYKGGIPARYGERASSVMAIKLGGSNEEQVHVKGGIGLLNSRLSIELPMAKRRINLLLGGRNSYSDWLLRKIPDVDLQNSSAGFYDLNALLTVNVNKNNRLSASGYYSSDRFSFSENTRYGYSNRVGSVRWNHVFGHTLSLSAMAGLSQYEFAVDDRDTLRLYDANRIRYSIRYNNCKVALSWFPGSRHAVELGVNGMLYRNSPGEMTPYGENSLVTAKTVQQEKALETAAYLSDDFTVSKLLGVEAGIRFVVYNSLGPRSEYVYANEANRSVETMTDTLYYATNSVISTYRGIEPRLALRLSISRQQSFKLSFTRINQFINLISNTAVISPTDTWKLNDRYFKPLVNDQLAAGYFLNFRHNSIETSVEVYYKKISNLPEYRNGARVLLNDHLETDMTGTSGFGYGVELFIKKNSGKASGWISYTYSRSQQKTGAIDKSGQINGNRYFQANFDIPHNLVVTANYRLSRRWRASATFNYHTGRPVTLPELKYTVDNNQLIWYSDRNKYRLPDYHRLDIAITRDQSLKLKKKWKASWTFSVINVYGRRNAYSAYYAREDARTWNYNGSYNLYKLYILGVPLPTLTYNFSF